MRSEWKRVPLGDLVGYISKGIAPSYADKESETTVRVLNQKCNRNFRISYSEARLHDLAQKKVGSERYVRSGDILINSTGVGTSGRIAQIDSVPCDTIVDGHMIIVRTNGAVTQKYLGYALKVHQQEVLQLDEGSTGQTELNRERLLDEILVSYPVERETQEKIVFCLEGIEKKIFTNEQINDNLQQQAQAIYQSLFVSFDGIPTNQLIDSELGLMPVGWTVKSLSEVTTSIRTKVQDNDYKVLSAINTGQLQLSEEHFNKQVFSKNISNYIVVEPFDFAYNPARINIGSIGMNTLGLTGCVSPVYVVIRTEPGYHHFFDFFVKTKRFSEEVKTRASGSVRQSLNNVDFGQIKVAYPPIDAVERFNREYTVRLKIMEQLKTENEKLVSIRDSLLPKLMSGEIDVSDVKL